MELYVLVGGVYSGEEDDDEEVTTEGGDGNTDRGGGGGGGGGMVRGGAAIEVAPEGTNSAAVEEMMLPVASLYFWFNISFLTALSSACKDRICCCKAEIVPMHPYTGSLSLKLAS